MEKRVKIGLIFWHLSKQKKKKLCVYFNCLVTCKTCSAHWIMRIRWFIYNIHPVYKKEKRVQFFNELQKTFVRLQNGTGTMRDSDDECWTDSEFMIVFLLCEKKLHVMVFYTHSLTHAGSPARSHRTENTTLANHHQTNRWNEPFFSSFLFTFKSK